MMLHRSGASQCKQAHNPTIIWALRLTYNLFAPDPAVAETSRGSWRLSPSSCCLGVFAFAGRHGIYGALVCCGRRHLLGEDAVVLSGVLSSVRSGQ